jgi:hypothetical protein
MAHITTAEVAAIRKELKAQLPEYKFSVCKGAGSHSVSVSILKGPVDFGATYESVNHYWMDRHYADRPAALEVLSMIELIIKTAPASVAGRGWFDESDVQSDYFHTAYYYNIAIGQWDNPYVCTAMIPA